MERRLNACVTTVQRARAAREGRVANRISGMIVLLLVRRMQHDEMTYLSSIQSSALYPALFLG